MYRHILVAVDGSQTSRSAIKESISLAKDQGSRLHVVHVVDATKVKSPTAAVDVGGHREALKSAGQQVIADCSAAIDQAGVTFDTACIVIEKPGKHIHDAIEEEAKRCKADLIVLGTHGRRGFQRLLLGSVAESLVRIASKPVLLVRGE